MLLTQRLADFIVKNKVTRFSVSGNKIILDDANLSDQYVKVKIEFDFQGNLGMPDGHYVMNDFPDLVTLLMGKNFKWTNRDNHVDICMGMIDTENKTIQFETANGIFTQAYTFQEVEEC
ncbi:hypothetical protein L5179_004030 [Vibrio parahaemolyticus]|uniref:hypothetical protein n=1 Tax=Vibrio parahaemolyticus TaxID=670 RepID=UPI001B843309|nr:hypothetical protein [Vibrio parahaemolyticus]EIU6761182.1 hypothetical protein [Vibrio parahaemolyticus]MDV5079659.1 hypothetical protein [Vibrio parahaemolyticus]HBC3852885.1 hypothetical protein [Vibrio parahaemolyticus]HBN6265507.1 hypothetical protein [Vibrio parahaemolyticus]